MFPPVDRRKGGRGGEAPPSSLVSDFSQPPEFENDWPISVLRRQEPSWVRLEASQGLFGGRIRLPDGSEQAQIIETAIVCL